MCIGAGERIEQINEEMEGGTYVAKGVIELDDTDLFVRRGSHS